MNHVYKVVWSKARNCYVVASELAKCHTKGAGRSVMGRTLVAGVLACVLSCGAVLPVYAAGDPVTYDDASKETITLEGPTGTGTKITGLANGALSAASSDAVTGAQLYEVSQQFDDFQSALSRNNTSIANAQTDINRIKTANITLQSDVNTLKTQMENGFNITIGGAKVKTVNPNSNHVNFVAGPGISITNDNESVKLSVSGDGVIVADNTGAITGGVAYTELRPATDGTYVKNNQTTAANLGALDTGLKAVADAVDAQNDSKANKDASNIGMKMTGDGVTDADKTANAVAWGEALGSGAVADGNSELVTGGTVFSEVRPADGTYVKNNQTTAANLGALDAQVKTNTEDITGLKNMSNITDTGKEVIRDLAKGSVKVVAGTHTTVTEGTDGNATTYAVNVTTDGAVADGNTGIVTGDTVYEYVKSVKEAQDTAVQEDLATKANVNASNVGRNMGSSATEDEINANLRNWGQALGAGQVTGGDARLVTGDTMHVELRPASDGQYVKTDNTTAENLALLDGQVYANAGKLDTHTTDITNLKDMSNLTEAGETVIKNLAKNSVKVIDGTNTTVRPGTDVDGFATYAVDVTTDGTVADGNTGIVTGGTMYSELRPAQDGDYVKGDKTTAENLGALDTALSEAVTNINGTLGNVVFYDSEAKDRVTFGGGSAGTVLANVKGGALSRTSMEAVNGSQLWAVKQDIAGFAADIKKNKDNISNLNTSVTAALESVSSSSQLVDTVNTTKADTSLNNLTSVGQQVIKTAAVNAVQEYMAQHNSNSNNSNDPVNTGLNTNYYTVNVADLIDDMSNNGDPSASVANGANASGNTNSFDSASMLGTSLRTNPGTGANYVVYDDANASTITLEGPTGVGTKLTNLAEGDLSAASTDAVTGAQLYETQQHFDDFQSALSRNNTSIARAQTDINNIKNVNITLQSDVNTLKTQMEAGFNVTVDGAKVKTVNPDSNYVNFVNGNNIEVTNTSGDVQFDVNAKGTVVSGDTGLVSGDTVYNESRLTTDGQYAKTGKTAAQNISALDDQVKANATAIEDLQGTVGGDFSSLRNDLNKKADADASNVAANTAKWGAAIGTGKVVSGNAELVTGGTVYRDTHVAADGSYVTAAKSAGENITALDVQMKKNTDAITGLQTAVGGDLSGLRDEVAQKANADASNVAEHTSKWGAAIGTGTVAAGNGELVTGDTVAKETRMAADGTYAKADKSAGENLSALDTQVKKNADSITSVRNGLNGLDGRVTTLEGAVSDVQGGFTNLKDSVDGLSGRMDTAETNITGLQNEMKTKANADASNVAEHTSKWGAAIGTGTVTADNGELVTGGTVYQALQDFTVSKEDIEKAMEDKMAGKLDKNLGNIDNTGKQVIRDTVKADLDKKANTDASNIDVAKWSEKLGTGAIAEGNKGLVNGDAVFEAIQSVNGTDLIGRDKEAGAIRIGAKSTYDGLDSVDFSKSDGTGRVLRGVVTDASDATSVANVGYVDTVAGQIAGAVDGEFNRMHDKVNKVGANAAALASLMPAPMEGDEKWSLSAAIGNYRSATAGAVGVFYKPQDNVIMNLRGSFGSNENMIGGGVSVSLNKGNTPGVSKAQLVRAVNAQASKLTEQDQIIQAQNQKILELEERMNQMAAAKAGEAKG